MEDKQDAMNEETMSPHEAEKDLVPPRMWPDLVDLMPDKCREVAEGEPDCLGIGRNQELGWFVMGSGQGPAILWSENEAAYQKNSGAVLGPVTDKNLFPRGVYIDDRGRLLIAYGDRKERGADPRGQRWRGRVYRYLEVADPVKTCSMRMPRCEGQDPLAQLDGQVAHDLAGKIARQLRQEAARLRLDALKLEEVARRCEDLPAYRRYPKDENSET